MKNIHLILTVLFLSTTIIYGQDQDSLIIFDRQGESRILDDILQQAQGKQYIFFGELHGQPEAHQLQLQLLQGLYQRYGDNVVLGMEMFEADVQPVIDEYFGDIINQRSFESESRIWSNYKDYKPMVEFAKENGISLVATNIPRRYANAVYHKSITVLDNLSDYAKQFLPELPMQVDTTLQSYKSVRDMIPGHGGENMLHSQAIKDATMAKYILLHSGEGKIVYHLNGSYHSNDREGIISFMRDIAPSQILTITTILEDELNLNDIQPFQKADFTLISKKKEEWPSSSF